MKVAIYCRVSTEEQNVDTQEEQCRLYCERMNYTVFKVYKDVISGTKSSRPEFNKMLDDMRLFKFDAIMVVRLDRLGRSLQHLLGLIEEFTKKGIHFISTTQNIDTSTSTGKFQMQILGAVAEFERNLISERTKEALKGNDRVGKRGKDKRPRQKRGGLKKPILLGEKKTKR